MIKCFFNVWCDFCHTPRRNDAGGEKTRHLVKALARRDGWEHIRVDDKLYDICKTCCDGRTTNELRQVIRAHSHAQEAK